MKFDWMFSVAQVFPGYDIVLATMDTPRRHIFPSDKLGSLLPNKVIINFKSKLASIVIFSEKYYSQKKVCTSTLAVAHTKYPYHFFAMNCNKVEQKTGKL